MSFRESTLYISNDYGKTFNVKTIKVGNNPAVLNYIYKSPTNHHMVNTSIIILRN